MIELIGLNGATVLVAPKTIYRVRATFPWEGRDATKVDYTGGYLYTVEPIADLLARLAAHIKMMQLTGRSGAAVHLNTASITQVREASPLNGPGTEILVGGRHQHVAESVGDVRALLET